MSRDIIKQYRIVHGLAASDSNVKVLSKDTYLVHQEEHQDQSWAEKSESTISIDGSFDGSIEKELARPSPGFSTNTKLCETNNYEDYIDTVTSLSKDELGFLNSASTFRKQTKTVPADNRASIASTMSVDSLFPPRPTTLNITAKTPDYVQTLIKENSLPPSALPLHEDLQKEFKRLEDDFSDGNKTLVD